MAWTQQSLAAHFYDAAEALAKADGRHFGPGADQDLKSLVAIGAHRLMAETPSNRLDYEVILATLRIQQLIEQAIVGARTIEGYEADMLGERSYFPARARFCPCRPFC